MKSNHGENLGELMGLGEKFDAFAELMRLGNCFMAGIAVLIGFFLANGTDLNLALIAFGVAFLVCGAGQAINDYFDAKIDAKLSKKRPIPSKRILPQEALYFSLALFLLGILCAIFINTPALIIAIIMAALLFAYPAFMNKIKYVGNVIVAVGTAITFVFGAASAGNIPALVVVLALSAFFSNMAREITKDIEDLKKDKGVKITLPMKTKSAKHFVALYYILAILLGIGAFTIFTLSYFYLLFTVIGALVFAYAVKALYNKKAMQSQSLSKKGMLVSLVAFILAGIK